MILVYIHYVLFFVLDRRSRNRLITKWCKESFEQLNGDFKSESKRSHLNNSSKNRIRYSIRAAGSWEETR